jgi:Fe-S-cluster containining protein
MKFQCQESCGGKCCTYPSEDHHVFLTRGDMRSIGIHLALNRGYVAHSEFAEKVKFDSTRFSKTGGEFYVLKRDPKKSCCSFLKDGKCSIYAARPTQCKTFPFWPELMDKQESITSCPGIGQGKELPLQVSHTKALEQKKADLEY